MNFDEIRDQIIKDIESHAEWHEEVSRGKMFGFLIHEGGVLKAYSGQILGRSDWEGYVPAIYDYLQPNGYFKTHENEITSLNARIKEAEALLPKGKRSREVEMMKAERKECSQALQRWLFSKFIITSPPLTGFCPPITGEPKGVKPHSVATLKTPVAPGIVGALLFRHYGAVNCLRLHLGPICWRKRR